MKCIVKEVNGTNEYVCPACNKSFQTARSCSAHMSSCRFNVGEEEYRARSIRRSKGMQGHTFSEDTIRKISESNRGQKRSEDTRKKISEAKIGKKLSDEHKQKIGDAHRGKSHPPYLKGYKYSEESRRHMSEARIGMKFSESHIENMRKSQLGKKQSEETREKRRKSMLKRYANGMPSHGVGTSKRSRSNGHTFRSNYETIVACYLQYRGIDYGYEDVRVNYDNRNWIMDFRVGQTLIEVKGIHSPKDDKIIEAFSSYGYEVEVIHGEYINLLYYKMLEEGLNVDELWDKAYNYEKQEGKILEWKVENKKIVFLN